MKAARWVTAIVTTPLVLGVGWLTLNSLEKRHGGVSKDVIAVRQAELILYACEAYRDNPANPERGKFPPALSLLTKPPFGGPSFLPDGEQDLIDPWGNPYHYEVVKNLNGEVEVRVCCMRNKDEGVILLGAERTADGTIRSFRAAP